jgi:hypothetical protein
VKEANLGRLGTTIGYSVKIKSKETVEIPVGARDKGEGRDGQAKHKGFPGQRKHSV